MAHRVVFRRIVLPSGQEDTQRPDILLEVRTHSEIALFGKKLVSLDQKIVYFYINSALKNPLYNRESV